MKTPPIAASEPCPRFTASTSQSAPAEAPGFQQVLQRIDSGITPHAASHQEENEVGEASYETSNAVSSANVTFPNPSLSSGNSSSVSAPGAYGAKHGVPGIVTGSARKERAASRTGSMNPKQYAQPSKPAAESNPDIAIPVGANANRAATPAPVPPAPGVHSSITPPADSAAETEPKAQPRPATSAPTDNHAAASATHDAPAPSAAGQSLPQSADTPTADSTSNLSSIPPLLNLNPEFVRESAISHSALRASGDASSSQPSIRYHIQAGSQPDHSSTITERTTAAAGQRDPIVGIASTVSAHSSAVSAGAAPLAATTTQSTTQSATQSAVQPAAQATTASTLFAQPGPTPAPVRSQHPSEAIPEPHTIDSGQLRVTPNNNELKISVQLPELGKVEVRAVTAHDVTTAHLTAFRHEALPILAADRTGLEQALKSRDVLLGSFASNTQGHSAGEQRQNNSPSFTPSAASAPSAPIAVTAEASTALSLPDYASISLHA